jgi:hypothetical protein
MFGIHGVGVPPNPLYHILDTGATLIKTHPKRVTKYFHPHLDFRICSPYTLACL